jgi:hypothetical protein
LPARGYARIDLSSLIERRLSDNLAVLTGAAARKKANGEDIIKFGMTCTLRRSGETWSNVVLVIHDLDAKP